MAGREKTLWSAPRRRPHLDHSRSLFFLRSIDRFPSLLRLQFSRENINSPPPNSPHHLSRTQGLSFSSHTLLLFRLFSDIMERILINLPNVQKNLHFWQSRLESYQKALRADPSYKPAAECLAIVLTDLGTSLKLSSNTRGNSEVL